MQNSEGALIVKNSLVIWDKHKLPENIYEDVIAESTDTGNLAMMSENDIETEVYNRFYSLSD